MCISNILIQSCKCKCTTYYNITYLCVWGENNNILLLNWLDLGTNQSFLESKIIMVCLCYSMFFLNKYGPSNWYVLFMVRKDKDVQSGRI